MKYLILLLLLVGCLDKKPLELPSENLYYKIVQMDKSGLATDSPIEHIFSRDGIVICEGDGEEEDEDDGGCTPVPVEIKSFSVKRISSGVIEICWEVDNEYNVDYYIVQRSKDGVIWNSISNTSTSGTGKYKVVDVLY